ncbi:MAG: NIPSNAP family protein [Alphaproteobacteria bacterium]
MAFYELRQYHIRKGKMRTWLKLMEGEIIPFQIAKGMVVCGSFQGESDPTVYVWLRRFDSEAERKKLYKAVYEDPRWLKEFAPKVYKLLDREKTQVQRIVPTKKSSVQ